MSQVSLAKIKRPGNVGKKQAIVDSLKLVDFTFPENIRKIVIKPNMCYYWDHTTGQTTDPSFVSALVEILRDDISSDVDISIIESDASAMKCKEAFRILGYEKMAERFAVDLVNLSEEKSERVSVTVNDETFSLMLPRIVKEADFRINIPKIKYMNDVKISCSLKNVYGCNPFPKKFLFHSKLDQIIVALNKIMKFDLSIVDASYVFGIYPRRLGLVMASKDLVALDAAAAKIAGIDPASIRHLILAEKEGIGNMHYTLRGVNIDYFKTRYPRQTATWKAWRLANKIIQMTGFGRLVGS